MAFCFADILLDQSFQRLTLTGFYIMGTLVGNGLKRACYFSIIERDF